MKSNTKILSEAAVSIALAGALNFIKIYALPQGGSITAGAMIPILWFALRRGLRWGIFAGVVFGFVVMLNPVDFFVVNPAQLILDYPIAFGLLGLAGNIQEASHARSRNRYSRKILRTLLVRSHILQYVCACWDESIHLLCNIQWKLSDGRISVKLGDYVLACEKTVSGIVSVVSRRLR